MELVYNWKQVSLHWNRYFDVVTPPLSNFKGWGTVIAFFKLSRSRHKICIKIESVPFKYPFFSVYQDQD